MIGGNAQLSLRFVSVPDLAALAAALAKLGWNVAEVRVRADGMYDVLWLNGQIGFFANKGDDFIYFKESLDTMIISTEPKRLPPVLIEVERALNDVGVKTYMGELNIAYEKVLELPYMDLLVAPSLMGELHLQGVLFIKGSPAAEEYLALSAVPVVPEAKRYLVAITYRDRWENVKKQALRASIFASEMEEALVKARRQGT